MANTNKQVRGFLNAISLKEYGVRYADISDKKAERVRNIGVKLSK